MNRIKIIALSMLAMAVVFSSCKKDDDDPLITPSGPSLTVTPTEVSAWVGDAITIEYTISTGSANEIISIDIESSETELPEVFLEGDDLDDNLATGMYSFTMPAGPAGSMWEDGDFFTVTFIATHDVDGTQYTTTKSVTCTYASPDTPMTDAQVGVIWNVIGPNQGAWDLDLNIGVSEVTANTTKDMINTTTDSSPLPETFESAWEAGNASTFVLDNTLDYDNATVESAAAAYAAGTASSAIADVQVGDIYVAEMRGTGTYSVIRIDNVVITTTNNQDKIEFSYKK